MAGSLSYITSQSLCFQGFNDRLFESGFRLDHRLGEGINIFACIKALAHGFLIFSEGLVDFPVGDDKLALRRGDEPAIDLSTLPMNKYPAIRPNALIDPALVLSHILSMVAYSYSLPMLNITAHKQCCQDEKMHKRDQELAGGKPLNLSPSPISYTPPTFRQGGRVTLVFS